MFDPQKMPSSAGGFPWKADGDFTTLVYIKNETDSPRKYITHLIYDGGQYSTGIRELKPGQTVAVDFRELRDGQTPDGTGRIIPLNIDKGQIAWSARGTEAKMLSGRSEQISIAGGVASTYSCANCCQDSFFQGGMTPFSTNSLVGDAVVFMAQQTDINCLNQFVGPYIPDLLTYYSTDSQVASVDSGGTASALSAGFASIGGSWKAVTWVNYGINCQSETEYPDEQAPMEVVCAYPVNFRQVGSGTDNGNGVLSFTYTWDSSYGTRANLSQCRLGEEVTYPTTDTSYYPPSPPFIYTYVNNPTNPPERYGDILSVIDNHKVPGNDNINIAPQFRTPYQVADYTAIQRYYYHCPCKNNDARTYFTGFNALEIRRTVGQTTGQIWGYVISKSGSIAGVLPLP